MNEENRKNSPGSLSCTSVLDITGEVCPMTFVRTVLALERLPTGAMLQVRLNAGEPLLNVPRSVAEHGHAVVSLTPEDPSKPGGPHLLVVKRA